MPGHDMVVIGTSAGGLEQLLWIVRGLPADFPAAICIVQHVAASGPSLLPEILTRMPVRCLQSTRATRRQIQRGQIYVAPPDRHMLVRNGHVHIVRGPKENGFRPAIDATFRTAALAYGPRVVGVILTGMLGDGTAGLLAVKRRGGVAIVQDPADAAFPSMPESALPLCGRRRRATSGRHPRAARAARNRSGRCPRRRAHVRGHETRS